MGARREPRIIPKSSNDVAGWAMDSGNRSNDVGDVKRKNRTPWFFINSRDSSVSPSKSVEISTSENVFELSSRKVRSV